MSRTLLITVRFHDGRYHGAGDGPPSPARLFQALVAGAGLGGPLDVAESEALKWLEEREPPLIASPLDVNGQSVKTYVPNNDLDAMGGDARRIGQIRTPKTIRPRVFNDAIPWLYAWAFDQNEESERHVQAVCALAERLYQFGRGIDMAWAWGEVLGDDEIEARLSNYPGLVHRPSHGGDRTLACPTKGSLASLQARYAENVRRFKTESHGKTARQLFSQQPKPRFAQVAYESPPSRRVYELRDGTTEAQFGVWPLACAPRLVVWLRDGAVTRLRQALPDRSPEIERILVGRKADGADDGPTSQRVKIVPLPSIGHHHADRGIRRVLVEVPASCPLRADDVYWAFSGLELNDPKTGEVLDLILTPSSDVSMLGYYGAADRVLSRVWHTVTPAALPDAAKRRRIEPTRVVAEVKGGAERAAEQARAAAAVNQALRHAEVRTAVESVRVQREPFEAKGERVEAFAPGTRFAKERLWHVEITFNAPIAGPLIIGDGRFLGLGVMAPLPQGQPVHAFMVEGGLAATPQPTEVARALRRAVMARVQEVLGSGTSLPSFFTGHDRDGLPTGTECPHLTFAFDPGAKRLLIVAPHVVDRRTPTREEVMHLASLDAAVTGLRVDARHGLIAPQNQLASLDAAVTGLRELRASSSGCLILRASSIDADSDPLFAPSRSWESVTPYQVTRHTKQVGAMEALSGDLRVECRRRGLPEPRVTPRGPRGVPGLGLVGSARLTFEVAVEGPIILGRSRHIGGGLFVGTP
jgi:CRISPR-associated protein Csb2